ncbi:hypothetical protein EV360DRAFT_85212 [Lentinula raphanica]|nr:hypothetical protein EV360DRAFT_85212 [Lentinula raphanica]
MDGRNIRIFQRQGLGNVLGGVGNVVSGLGSGINSAVSDVGAGVTSGLGQITSAILPSTTTPTTTTTSTSISSTSVTSSTSTSSSSSSSSTIRTSTSSTLTSSMTSIASSSTTSSLTSSSATSSSTPTVFSSPSVYTSTSDGVQETITAFVTSSAAPSPTQTSNNASSGFLNNKPLEGFVFALCGIVAIVILFLVTTFALRRSRRKKMINEALSYEPTTTHGYTDDMNRNLMEKSRESYSSTGSAGSGRGPPYSGGVSGPPVIGQQQVGYGYEREYPAYAPRTPNPAYDVTRSYGPSYGYTTNQVSQAPVTYPIGVSHPASANTETQAMAMAPIPV